MGHLDSNGPKLDPEPRGNELRYSEAAFWQEFGARDQAGDLAGADPLWLLLEIGEQASDLSHRRSEWGERYPWHQDLYLVKRLVMLNLALERVIEARREEAERAKEDIPF